MEITEDRNAIEALLRDATTANVLGFKEEGTVFSISLYLHNNGYHVTGVNPKIEKNEIFEVVSSLADAPTSDIVVVFRRSDALMGHLDEFLKSGAKAIWFQLGIRDDEVARQLVDAGLLVVQDRCIKVEHFQLLAS